MNYIFSTPIKKNLYILGFCESVHVS